MSPFLTPADLRTILKPLGMTYGSFVRLAAAGQAPAPAVRISSRRPRWRLADVQAYLAGIGVTFEPWASQ